jgi:hypothetical protein
VVVEEDGNQRGVTSRKRGTGAVARYLRETGQGFYLCCLCPVFEISKLDSG